MGTAQQARVTQLTGAYPLERRTHPGIPKCDQGGDDGFLTHPCTAFLMSETPTALGTGIRPRSVRMLAPQTWLGSIRVHAPALTVYA